RQAILRERAGFRSGSSCFSSEISLQELSRNFRQRDQKFSRTVERSRSLFRSCLHGGRRSSLGRFHARIPELSVGHSAKARGKRNGGGRAGRSCLDGTLRIARRRREAGGQIRFIFGSRLFEGLAEGGSVSDFGRSTSPGR